MTGDAKTLTVIDMHAGGDVSRIVVGGLGAIPGASLRDQARHLERNADGLRRLLLSEPHGNPAMSADLIVPPVDPRAEAGFIVMEAMGYPAFSGSNAICTVTALLESGRLPMADGTRRVALEAPVGVIEMTAECRAGRVVAASYISEPAYVARRGLSATPAGYGPVAFDLVWSGVFYAVVDAAALGLPLAREGLPALAAFAGAFIEAAGPALDLRHPDLGAVGPLSFVLFTEPAERRGPGAWAAKIAAYVHPGVVCRSPTGTGTTARIALLAAEGALEAGDRLETRSPLGTGFTGRLVGPGPVGPARVGGGEGVVTEISGRAHTLARAEIVVDTADPLIEAEGIARILAP